MICLKKYTEVHRYLGHTANKCTKSIIPSADYKENTIYGNIHIYMRINTGKEIKT